MASKVKKKKLKVKKATIDSLEKNVIRLQTQVSLLSYQVQKLTTPVSFSVSEMVKNGILSPLSAVNITDTPLSCKKMEEYHPFGNQEKMQKIADKAIEYAPLAVIFALFILAFI